LSWERVLSVLRTLFSEEGVGGLLMRDGRLQGGSA
jgi:hypothetical protein